MNLKACGSSLRLGLIGICVCSATLYAALASQRQDVEAKIDALLSRMTLEEKLGQLQQLDGEANGNYRPEHVDLIKRGLLGSTLNVRGARKTNELNALPSSNPG